MRSFFSLKGVFTTKNLAVMAMMVALTMVLSPITTFFIPHRITFAYLPGIIVAMLYGPWAAVLFGFVSDFAGYIVFPTGPYHPGFAISDSVHYFIFACFLYGRKFSVRQYLWRITIARLLVTGIILYALDFVWLSHLFGSTVATFFTSTRAISHLGLLPVHVGMMLALTKVTHEVAHRRGVA